VGSFDRELRSVLSQTTNCKFTDASWLQARLPVRFGGLGIQCARNLAAPAYLASLQASEQLSAVILSPMAGLTLDLSQWLEGQLFGVLEECTGQFHRHSCFRRGAEGLDSVFLDSLIASSSGADRARLLAVSSPHSSVWINALPSNSLGLCLGNDETSIAIGLHAGVNLDLPHSCVMHDFCHLWLRHSMYGDRRLLPWFRSWVEELLLSLVNPVQHRPPAENRCSITERECCFNNGNLTAIPAP